MRREAGRSGGSGFLRGEASGKPSKDGGVSGTGAVRLVRASYPAWAEWAGEALRGSFQHGAIAVESIRRWWRLMGRRAYPTAARLLICADAGGSNGNRLRAWKVHLQRLGDELRLPITVCHYPPGTSKWNKIEHRLFSFISMNWKGQPLVSYEAIVNLIGRTRTRSGLVVKAVLDRRDYETGHAVTPKELKALRLQGHSFHPDWNYTLVPHAVN